MKTKRISFLIAVVMLLGLLAGCTGNVANPPEKNPPNTTNTPPSDGTPTDHLVYNTEKVNNGDPITISFWVPGEDAIIDVAEKYMAEYVALHPNVSFAFDDTRDWDTYWTQLPIEIASGTGPDLFWMHNAYDATMKPLLAPMPKSVFPEEALMNDFRQVASHKTDGQYYYIDTGLMSSLVIYNKQMWDDAGLTDADIPGTWDELLEVAKKLVKTDEAGNILVNGFSYNGGIAFMNLVTAMNYQKGMFTFSADGSTSVLNNPVTIENMEYLRSWYDEHKVGAHAESDTFTELSSGKTAMICEFSWVPGNVGDLEVGVFPTPTFDGSAPAVDRNNGECSPCVSNKASAEAQAAAFDFVKFLIANDDFIREFAISQGIFPSKYSLENDPAIAASKTLQVLGETIDRTLWIGPMPGQVEDTFGTIQASFLFENTPAEDTLAVADRQIAEDIADTGFVPLERTYSNAAKFSN